MEATVSPPYETTDAPHTPHRIVDAGIPSRMDSDRARELIRLRWDREKAAKEAALNQPNVERTTADDFEAKARAKQEKESRNAQEQVAMLSKRLSSALADEKTAPIDIERLQRSLSSAREDERKLSGRSLPPTLKAGPSKPQRQRAPMSDPT